MDSDYVNKCLELFDKHPEILKPRRDREYIEKRPDIKKYYITLRKRIDKDRTAGKAWDTQSEKSVGSVKSYKSVGSVIKDKTVSFTQDSVIPDMTQMVNQSFEEGKQLQPEPIPEYQTNDVEKVQGWLDTQKQGKEIILSPPETNLSARRMRLQILLARDDLNDDAMKILEKTRKLKIHQMDEEELNAMEELTAMALSKHYAKATGQKILESVSHVIEKSTQRPPNTIASVVEKDKLLQEDFATVLSKYAVGTSTVLRAIILFGFDVGSALLQAPLENKQSEVAEPSGK